MARQNLELYLAKDRMPLPDTPELWAFKTQNVLNLRFMLCLLTVICPKEFFITAGSIEDVLTDQK